MKFKQAITSKKHWAFLCKIIVHSFDLNVIASFMGNLDVLSIKCSIFLEILKLPLIIQKFMNMIHLTLMTALTSTLVQGQFTH